LPTPALTALASINLIGVRSESTLVVVGATGSLGAAAVQLSIARGAIVVAVVQEKQQDDARAFGAQHVVVSGDDVATTIRGLFADGVDAVLDTAASSQDELAKWADVLKPNGMLVSPNHVADEAFFAQRGMRAKNITLTEEPEASADGLRTLTKSVLDGTLRVVVGEHGSLAEAGDFLDRGERHDLHAKAVLAV
jgi:NADPH:quinone reductase-like Zn-dependent oxidoreductase